MNHARSLSAVAAALVLASGLAHAQGSITGERKQWHKVTITFDGPSTNEGATPNPFSDYRLNVSFTPPGGGTALVVPGYYAADGDAGDTGATAGNKWRVHVTPDRTGTWTYTASFRTGTNLAMSTDASAGTATSFNGQSGSFAVSGSDKTGRDHRGKGMLRYVGEHYLRFAGTGEWYLKVGPDSPEGFLANPDFDGSTTGTRSSFDAHAQHWKAGDPTWAGGKGKRVIGAVNYVSGKGMNVFYLLTFSGYGDTKSVWPYRSVDDRFRFDCSKLDQWELAFEHMDRMGMLIHLVFSETENEAYWEVKDGESGFGRSRKLYYRELIARFAHHPAVVWNLGEENGWNDGSTSAYKAGNTDAQRKSFCDFIRGQDPYDHPIVVHHVPGMDDAVYGPLVGYPRFEGTSIQLSYDNFGMQATNDRVIEWVDKSRNGGRKWIVCVDEPGHDNIPRNGDSAGVRPDVDDPGHDIPRKYSLWGALMGGAAGHETYFGWAFTPNGGGDGAVSNYAAWDKWWNQCRYAHQFFTANLPLTRMKHDNALTGGTSDYVLAERGEVYAVYLRDGGSPTLDLTGYSGTFEVKWFDPRSGGVLQNGSVATVSGGAKRPLGSAPNNPTKDWALLVRRSGVVAPTMAVTGFTLYDADADQPVTALTSGATLNLATLPTRNLNIRANTSPAAVGSVRFGYDGNSSYRLENQGPYTIGGGTATDYDAWTPSVGSHSLSATPYSGADASGTAGTSLTITFTVVDQPATGGPAVTGLTLMNADTDQPIAGYNPMAANLTLNLATLPTRRLNVRANVSGSPLGSVRFAYDGDADFRIESGAPYAFAGDASGDYAAWTPTTGAHTIQAVPYTGSGATGAAGTSATVHLSVVDSASTASAVLPEEELPAEEVKPATSEAGDGAGGGGGGGGCGLTGLEILLAPALIRLLRRRR